MSGGKPVDQKFFRWGNPVLWGILFTAMLIAGFGWVMLLEDCVSNSCETKWSKLLSSEPNEIGDTLAGLAGSLAFLWIIVTVILQSQELREQRKELREQREATQSMADAMDAQVELLRIQSKILASELSMESERRLDGFVNELVEELSFIMQYSLEQMDTWVIKNENPSGSEDGFLRIRLSETKPESGKDFLNYSINACRIVMIFHGEEPCYEKGYDLFIKCPPRSLYPEKIRNILQRIMQEEEKCSPQFRAHLEAIGIFKFDKWYGHLFNIEKLWGDI